MFRIFLALVLSAFLVVPATAGDRSFSITGQFSGWGEATPFVYFGGPTFSTGGDETFQFQPILGGGLIKGKEWCFFGASCQPFIGGVGFEDDGRGGGAFFYGQRYSVTDLGPINVGAGALAGFAFGGREEWPVYPAASSFLDFRCDGCGLTSGVPSLMVQGTYADGGAKFFAGLKFEF